VRLTHCNTCCSTHCNTHCNIHCSTRPNIAPYIPHNIFFVPREIQQEGGGSIAQHTATHCNLLQHPATHCNTLQHTAICCNTSQHTATHCNTLQHTATHCNTRTAGRFDEKSNKKVVDLLLNATHFSKSTQAASTVTFVGQDVTEAKQVHTLLQCVAVSCSVLQCPAVCFK